MSEINNIHDTFFRETMSHKEAAADFLANYLPTTVLEQINARNTGHHLSQSLSAGKDEVLMTVAERLEKRGEAKGRVEGEARGRNAILRRQLAKRFGQDILISAYRNACAMPRLNSWTIGRNGFWTQRHSKKFLKNNSPPLEVVWQPPVPACPAFAHPRHLNPTFDSH
jgi:hypothetical protein